VYPKTRWEALTGALAQSERANPWPPSSGRRSSGRWIIERKHALGFHIEQRGTLQIVKQSGVEGSHERLRAGAAKIDYSQRGFAARLVDPCHDVLRKYGYGKERQQEQEEVQSMSFFPSLS